MPAFLDDALVVETSILSIKNTSFVMRQSVMREKELVADMKVVVVCVDKDTIKPVRLPDMIKQQFEDYIIG